MRQYDLSLGYQAFERMRAGVECDASLLGPALDARGQSDIRARVDPPMRWPP